MIKLNYEGDYGLKVSVESEDAVTLTDALELIEQLLRGAGYAFDGYVTIVNPDGEKTQDKYVDTEEDIQ